MTNIPTEFPLSHRNYSAKRFAGLYGMNVSRIYNFRKAKRKNKFWVCCIENDFVKGFEINEDYYLIWRAGGNKLEALISYRENQEKAYAELSQD